MKKLKELLKNKQVLGSVILVGGLLILAILQLIFKF